LSDIPEADHWAKVKADGEARTVQGRREYGTPDECALVHLSDLREELLDAVNYCAWAQANLAEGPRGQQRIFVSGPYTADDPQDTLDFISVAREAQVELFRRGHYPFCPHVGSAGYENRYLDIPKSAYLEWSLAFLPVCHAILMLDGWQDSAGATAEHAAAEKLKLTVYYSLDDVPDLRGEGSRAAAFAE